MSNNTIGFLSIFLALFCCLNKAVWLLLLWCWNKSHSFVMQMYLLIPPITFPALPFPVTIHCSLGVDTETCCVIRTCSWWFDVYSKHSPYGLMALLRNENLSSLLHSSVLTVKTFFTIKKIKTRCFWCWVFSTAVVWIVRLARDSTQYAAVICYSLKT